MHAVGDRRGYRRMRANEMNTFFLHTAFATVAALELVDAWWVFAVGLDLEH